MAGGERERHGWPVIDDGPLVGCDKQRAGTPHPRSGVPALPLVTPCKFTNLVSRERHAQEVDAGPAGQYGVSAGIPEATSRDRATGFDEDASSHESQTCQILMS